MEGINKIGKVAIKYIKGYSNKDKNYKIKIIKTYYDEPVMLSIASKGKIYIVSIVENELRGANKDDIIEILISEHSERNKVQDILRKEKIGTKGYSELINGETVYKKTSINGIEHGCRKLNEKTLKRELTRAKWTARYIKG